MKTVFKILQKISLKDFLWLALGAIFLINMGVIWQNKSLVAKKKAIADEFARPANISITLINESSCQDCANLSNYINAVKKQNVKITGEETLEAKSEAGQKIIKELDIKKLPTFVVKGELEKFDGLKNILAAFGQVNKDTFKFTGFAAPYLDLASNQIKGRVGLALISYKSCAECQNAGIYKQIIARFGLLKFSSEANLDRSDAEAKKLIQKYKISALPAFILTGEVSEYDSLTKTWPQVGTIEKDGAYVFRKVELTGLVYSDLKTGKVVKPGAVTPTPAPK